MPARLAMEEGNRETQALQLRNVRRRLFQEDQQMGNDQNEVNLFMEETRKNSQQAKEKWNFDFEKEEPLPGKYEWVRPNEEFPSEKKPQEENEKQQITKESNENSTNS